MNYRWLLLQIPGKFTQDLHCRNCNCWCSLLRSKVFKLTGHFSVFFDKFVVMGSAVANKRNLSRIPHLSVNPDILKVLYLLHGVVPLLPNPGGWGSVGGGLSCNMHSHPWKQLVNNLWGVANHYDIFSRIGYKIQ